VLRSCEKRGCSLSKHDDEVRLRHMLDHANEAVELVRGRSDEDLSADRVLQLALVRLVEIVGEAGSRVSKEIQDRNPQIPWAQIVSMRNRLIHGYDFLDLDILRQTIAEDLPALIAELKRLV